MEKLNSNNGIGAEGNASGAGEIPAPLLHQNIRLPSPAIPRDVTRVFLPTNTTPAETFKFDFRGVKIFFATPVGRGDVRVEFMQSCLETMDAAQKIGAGIMFVQSIGKPVVNARNDLVKSFLESDCTHLVFVDDDMEWSGHDVLRVIAHDKDVVGIAARKRGDEVRFCAALEPDTGINVLDGIVPVQAVGTGFMCIKRGVLEHLCSVDGVEEVADDNNFERKIKRVFVDKVIGGRLWSEDFTFCLLAKEHGFDIYCDPFIEIGHIGTKNYKGAFISELLESTKYRSPITIKEA